MSFCNCLFSSSSGEVLFSARGLGLGLGLADALAPAMAESSASPKAFLPVLLVTTALADVLVPARVISAPHMIDYKESHVHNASEKKHTEGETVK